MKADRLPKEAGIALVLVLWVLTLLSVIAGQFCYAMRTEVNITRNFKDSTQAYYIARAGLSRAIAELIRNQLFPRASEPGAEAGAGDEAAPVDTENLWRINVENPPVDFADGQFTIWLENESGKIDLNGADQGLLLMLLNGFDLDETEKETIVDSILDWRDADDFHRLNGAESDYYQSLPTPYACKNADFDAIEELLLVKGVTAEIFNGGLDQIVTVSGAGGAQGRQGGLAQTPARRGRLRSPTPVVRATGRSQININAASRRVLLALPLMTEEIADAIANFRKEKDFKSLTEVQEVVGAEAFAAISPYIGLQESPIYTIHATGKLAESPARRTVRVRVEISGRYDNRYRVLAWIDG